MNRVHTFLKAFASALLLLAGLTCPAFAADKKKEEGAPWWNKEWTVRKKFTLDASSSGVAITEPIGSAVVLVRLFEGSFQFGSAKEDGSDIRFISADGKTELPFHLEKFDSLMYEGFAWVRLPDLKSGEKTEFWLYSGNPAAAYSGDSKATYAPGAALIYHFNEQSAPAADSSGNAITAEAAAIPSGGALIGGGITLNGSSVVKIPADPALEWKEGMSLTWSAWVKPATLAPNAWIFGRREGTEAFVVGLNDGKPFVELSVAGATQRSGEGEAIPVGTWKHIAVVAAGSTTTLYLDGVQYATVAAPIPALKTASTIGGDGSDGATGGFAGELDELQIHSEALPAGRIKLAGIGESGSEAAKKLLTFGEDEGGAGGGSHGPDALGIIISNLAHDPAAVVVIILCAIMSIISWFIMISKGKYLGTVGKANKQFIKEWGHLASDLTALDGTDAEAAKTLGGRFNKAAHRTIKNSPIYRIYHVGAEEIRHRLNGATTNQRILSAGSIPAIRSSMDGAMVREMQKLNSMMVLLTIAISGGPFLGLLGTVWGVMTTFGGVAAAGDVNVNAIAPGIAAALLATIAGLGVAIPALFGYNYLLTQVKSATSDMHVFVDEFITKMAEFYCRDVEPVGAGH